MVRRSSTPRVVALWPLWGVLLLIAHGVCLAFLHARPGRLAVVPYLVVPKVLFALAAITLAGAMFDLLHSGWRRLLRGHTLFDGLVLLAALLVPLFAYRAYPSSYDERPATLCLGLPLRGDIGVLQGGASVIGNAHAGSPSQRYAYDLAIVDTHARFHAEGDSLDEYSTYGQPVLAPAHGSVVAVRDGHPDHSPGSSASLLLRRGFGNFVVLQIDHGQYLVIAHLQAGSIVVQAGDEIDAGTPIARVGNSGGSDAPHLHMHLQDAEAPGSGEGIPIDLCGYEAVDWGASWDTARSFERGMPSGRSRRQIIRARRDVDF
jgi:hypothetical protein